MRKIKLILIGALYYLSCNAPILDEYHLNISNNNFKYINEQKRIYEEKEEFNSFLNHLAVRESSSNWKIYNRWGYIGLYQIGRAARNDVGYGHIHFKDFINNPYIFPVENQKDAVIKLMNINLERMKPYSTKYYLLLLSIEGQEINNVKVTLSGIIAGAHLAGPRNVVRYIKSNGQFDPMDALGTRLSDYVKEFSGYKFNEIYYE